MVTNEYLNNQFDLLYSGLGIINSKKVLKEKFLNFNFSSLRESFFDFLQTGSISIEDVDHFYAVVNYLLSKDLSALHDIVRTKGDAHTLLFKLVTALPDESQAEKYKDNISNYFYKNDDDLLSEFNNAITIDDVNLESYEWGVFFSKLNHGFWEHFITSFLYEQQSLFEENNYRVIKNERRLIGVKLSGFYDEMEFLLGLYYSGKLPSIEFGVNLKAGKESVKTSLKRGVLTKVQKGAVVGMLALHHDFDKQKKIYRDGASPRRLVSDSNFGTFCRKFIEPSKDLLIVGPARLSESVFTGFKGQEHYLALPAVVVHETWKVSLLITVGKIDQIITKSNKLCVLVQSANFASMLCLYLPIIFDKDQLKKITFFDLGRVLDIYDQNIISNYPSFSQVIKNHPNGFSEYMKRIKNN